MTVGPSIFLEESVYLWTAFLLGTHVFLQILFASIRNPFQVKPGVAAHQVVCVVPFTFAAVHGVRLWLFDDHLRVLHAGTATDRYWAPVTSATEPYFMLCRFMIGFQLYDLLSTFLVADLRKAEHLGHHVSTLLTAYSGAASGGPYFLYYSAFFFGFIEVSSVPLAFVDLFRQFPSLAKHPLGSQFNEVVRLLFGVSFLVTRCVLFPMVMLTRFWPDMRDVISAADVRCGWPILAWMAFSSAFLTFMQLFWGFKIVKVLLKGNLSGKNADAAKTEAD